MAAPSQGRPDRPDWHGRRLGKKLRVGQKDLLENLLPRLQITPSNPDPQFETTMSEVPEQVWLEIGFGGGEHLAAQAQANPQTGFIGCEPFINGVAKLLTSIQADNLKNIRICDDDARPLLDVMDDQFIDRALSCSRTRGRKSAITSVALLLKKTSIVLPGS